MAHIKWSTPERRIGTRQLPLIPNEIYFDLLDLVEHAEETTEAEAKKALSNLALVCRLFCAMCLPRIFRSIKFIGDGSEEGGPKYATFCRELINDKEPARSIAPFVKECHFKGWYPPSENLSWAFTAFLNLHTQAVTRLINIEALHFDLTPVNKKHFHVIKMLKKLKYLSFGQCKFSLTANDIPNSLPNLISLRFDTSQHGPGIIDALVAATTSPSLRKLQTSIPAFLHTFMNRPGKFRLEDLEITTSNVDVPLVHKFLEATPSIRRLAITTTKPTLRLPKSSLPQLQHVECPFGMAAGLIRGRPIETLRVILIDNDSLSNLVETIRSQWPKCSSLRRFHMNFLSSVFYGPPPTWYYDLELQNRLIKGTVAIMFPSIDCVQFVEYVEWHRTPGNTSCWKPVVSRKPFDLDLKQHLSFAQHIKDFDGFFAEFRA